MKKYLNDSEAIKKIIKNKNNSMCHKQITFITASIQIPKTNNTTIKLKTPTNSTRNIEINMIRNTSDLFE